MNLEIWLLWAVLETGESGPVPVSRMICELTESEVSAGKVVTAERAFDTPRILEASCLGPYLPPSDGICEEPAS